MITPIIHASIRPATSPPKPLRPIIIELLLIPTKLLLELLLDLVGLVLEHMAPTRLFLRTVPRDELQLAFVFAAVLAFPVPVVPGFVRVLAELFVRWPVGALADGAWGRC